MEIFKLVGSIFVDSEEANKSLSKTDEKANSVGKSLLGGVASAGKFALGVGAAAAAGATALMGVATKSAETAKEIDVMSERIGFSKQAYQEWSYIAEQCGTSMDTLQGGITDLAEKMDDAKAGTGEAAEIFDRLGVSVVDSNGNLRDQQAVFEETILALQGMENAAERQALATKLMSTTGEELLPLLNSEAGSMEEMKQKAHDLGLVMSDDAVNAGVVFGDTLDDVKQSFGMMVNTIGVQVMPIIQKLLDWVLANMPAIQEVFGEVFTVVGEIVSAAMVVIESLMPVIEKVFGFVGELWNTSLKPILSNIIEFIKNIFTGNFKGAFENLINIVKGIWDGIISIIKVPINGVIKLINGFIGGLNKLKVPDWVPGIGGKGINIPKIPLLAKGGNVISGGQAIVGEAGPELIELPVGAKVTPLTNGKGQALGTDNLERKLDTLIALMQRMVNSQYGVYINGDALVGELIPSIDQGLGRLAIRNGRGA